MSNQADLYVSNGTCYYGGGQVSDPRYIPCGNAQLSGIQHCCFEGSYCLDSYACYDTSSGVTYLAGCTDPTFLDEQCAQKPGYKGQQWVAMARCSGENISLWTGCAHHPQKVELEKENCSCNLTNVLIENTNGQSSLGEIGSLPTSAGGTISFNPTALPTYAATSTGNSSSVASGTPTATATGSTSGGGGSNGLSGGAKAGIAVGSIIGGLLVLGALAFLFRRAYRRRLDRAVAARTGSGLSGPPHQPSPLSQHVSQVTPASRYTVSPETVKSEEEGQIAGLGYKFEMPTEASHRPELQGDVGGISQHRPRPHELGT
ncbi:hypothetical protein N8I77_007173 [Diaporthe amygdali]|uniref:Uncharacterized protein n=1 Tax=Phomopsis amygdali TaxID=1214568 RepID=A0AAD9SDV8_PHOAM|nr:hypothetical protein N8I77_007173 [Diaporthe amygdali]